MPYKQSIDIFLMLSKDRGAADFYLCVGRPPLYRRSGRLVPMHHRIITASDWQDMIKPIVRPDVWRDFCAGGDAGFAYEISRAARFRVSLFKQERGNGAVFRVVQGSVIPVEQLGLPDSVWRFAELRSGLVIVAGPASSGKTTILAALVHLVNRHRECHIITLEDPIECVHEPIKSLVHQRELGKHIRSFPEGLRSAAREDPDVIMLGEMPDATTIRLALESAEKGVLLLGSMHTNSVAKTIDSMVGMFPTDEQDNIQSALSESLQGMLVQRLLPGSEGQRVAAVELLFATDPVRALIREGKTGDIAAILHAESKAGMRAMDASIMNLYEAGLITAQCAYDTCTDKDMFAPLLKTSGRRDR